MKETKKQRSKSPSVSQLDSNDLCDLGKVKSFLTAQFPHL